MESSLSTEYFTVVSNSSCLILFPLKKYLGFVHYFARINTLFWVLAHFYMVECLLTFTWHIIQEWKLKSKILKLLKLLLIVLRLFLEWKLLGKKLHQEVEESCVGSVVKNSPRWVEYTEVQRTVTLASGYKCGACVMGDLNNW